MPLLNVRVLTVTFLLWQLVTTVLRCGDEDEEAKSVRYFRIKSCHKLNSSVIARAPLRAFNECAAFTAEKRGLAFNFSPYKLARPVGGGVRPNCEVLGCPDLGNLATLVNDTNYDYYTMYGNTEAIANATCIPGVGVFAVYVQRENYTGAENVCTADGARLAHVASETRSAGVVGLLRTRLPGFVQAAYVGLVVEEQQVRTVTKEPLECYGYRAWAPGHPRPRRHHRCVLLDAVGFWRTCDCAWPMPFVCELQPQVPHLHEYLPFSNTSCGNVRNKTMRATCHTIKKKYKEAVLSSHTYKKRRRKSECDKD